MVQDEKLLLNNSEAEASIAFLITVITMVRLKFLHTGLSGAGQPSE